MKQYALFAAIVVLLLVGYVPWPYDKFALALTAHSRVERDLVDGYPAALERSQEVAALVHRHRPELRRARYSWTEVRCSIDDLVTQFPTGYFAQDCSLRRVWMMPTPFGGPCAPSEDLYGANDPERDATATLLQVGSAELEAAPDPGFPDWCPALGPESRDLSVFHYGTNYPRLLHGRWPDDLQESGAWRIFEVEVFLSSTEIGCLPAFGFCTSRFDAPAMDAVDKLLTSTGPGAP